VLKLAHPALQRRVIRQWLQQILPEAPNFDQIEKLTALISAPNRTQTDPFPGGAIATVQGDWICWLISRS
jgi:tRNA(Ile)-lysidine synthase